MMKPKLTTAIWAFTASLVGAALISAAQAAEDGPPKIAIETVYSGLDHPCGVAVQPTTGSVFVSESGTGKIVRFPPTELGKPTAAITGFPVNASGDGPFHKAGPLGLAFLHQNLVVVGGSNRNDGEDVIRVYELPADATANDKTLNFNDAKQTLSRMWTGETHSTGDINFWGVAMSPSALWITSQGSRDRGWLLKAAIDGSAIEEVTPFLRTKDALPTDGPMGIAVRNSREFLVVGFTGKFDAPHDSVLAFFSMRNRSLMMAMPVKLHDLVALAYSPQSNRLYAVDLAWSSPKEGALYRLDSAMIDDRAGVKLVKLASLDRPTALAFTPDNMLYVTAIGENVDDQDEPDAETAKKGVLVKITGDL